LALALPVLKYDWIGESLRARELLPLARFLVPYGHCNALNRSVSVRYLTEEK
jgi:hypothetical protein